MHGKTQLVASISMTLTSDERDGTASTCPQCPSDTEVGLGPVVEHEHQGAPDAADHICQEPLVQALCHALLGSNLLEAVHGALVEVLLHGLLRLHLQAPAHGVEGVGGARTNGDCRLGSGKGCHGAQDTLVLLPRVQAGDRVEGAELQPAVPHDANHRDPKTCVKCHDASWALGCAVHAVAQAGECLLARADVGGKPRPRVVQGVNNAETSRCSQAARDEVGAKELCELGLGVVLGEHLFEGVLEGQVEGLRGEVADAVGEVPVPEAPHALLLVNAHAAVNDALVPWHLAAADLGVGILGLHHELDALNGSSERLRNGPGDSAEREVDEERLRRVRHG
mmetsp:Transcript_151931/g.368924  ORF Transcript_151931/g.368924 Transcript_151931/m.368924 type:complete len:338 (-) Transcript_151931:85-1098(-)